MWRAVLAWVVRKAFLKNDIVAKTFRTGRMVFREGTQGAGTSPWAGILLETENREEAAMTGVE